MSKPKRAGLGSSFEDFLKEIGDYDAVNNAALKRVVAWQLEQERAAQGLSKVALAERLNTSRSQLNRLLDPDNDDVTLAALKRAATALGRSIRMELGDELVVASKLKPLGRAGAGKFIPGVGIGKAAAAAKRARNTRKTSRTSARTAKRA